MNKGTLRRLAEYYAYVKETMPQLSRFDCLTEAIGLDRFEKLDDAADLVLKIPDIKEDCGEFHVLANDTIEPDAKEYSGIFRVAANGTPEPICADNSRAVVFLGKEPQKYLFARGFLHHDYYIVTLPTCSMHYQIADKLRNVLDEQLFKISGGFMKYEDGTLRLYGKSQDFGEADHQEVARILNKLGLNTKVGEN